MSDDRSRHLSRRERQIMDVIYARGRASAADVRDRLPDAPSYSAVRALLRILEEKGHLRHEVEDNRYIFVPTVPRERARERALEHVLHTFFDGSAASAMAALMEIGDRELTGDEIDRLQTMIDEAKEQGR